MPWNYFIDKQRRVVISTGWGRLTFAEARDHQDQLSRDADFDPTFSQLVDFTELTIFDLSPAEAQTMADRKIFFAGARRAIVAPKPAVFGMGRFMQIRHELAGAQAEVQVFYERKEALRWLGLDDLL